jgi:cyclase
MKYANPVYVGDPINAVRIFNEKEVDELVFLDISATPNSRPPNFDLIRDIASEAFMPFAYGGGVTTIDDFKQLFHLGVEKVVVNSIAAARPDLISAAAKEAGSQSVVASIDVKRNWSGSYSVYTRSGSWNTKKDPVSSAISLENAGAGEIFLTSVDRDGTMSGYDYELIKKVCDAVSIPVIASGGAGSLEHFKQAIHMGASAVAAGSMFVFHGKHKAVLITYPDYADLEKLFRHDNPPA